MNKIFYICIGVAVCLATLYACVKDSTTDANQSNNPNAFLTVEEAQAFFEESFSSDTRSSSESSTSKFLDPGDYTPLWSDAQMSQNATLGSVDVPILSEYRYRAIRSEFKNGKAKSYTVKITQQLIVVKSKETQAKAQYLLMLIPDKESDANDFVNSGDKGNYSGYALYMSRGVPVRLNKYRHGKKVIGVSVIGVTDKLIAVKRLKIMLRELSKMTIQRSCDVFQTRSGGSDYTWADWLKDNWDNIPDGTKFYFDEYGNVYVDTNNDGDYDDNELIWIGDGNGDTSTDPDSETTGDNTITNNGSGGGTDSSSTSGGTTQTDDNNVGDSEGTTSNENGDDDITTTSSKKTDTQITQTAKNVVADIISKYGSTEAQCNTGVQNMFKSLYNGSTVLDGMQANDMVKYWQDNPSSWESININDAQVLASEGWFVVAGWINTTGLSGHVCVIMPGDMISSGEWGCNVPLTMDTGENNRWPTDNTPSKGLSYSFGSNKKETVEFYKYK